MPRILDVLGVPDDVIVRELKHFDTAVFTKTVERTLLGSLNEICGVINLQDDKEGARSPRHLDELEDLFANFIHLQMPEKHTADEPRATKSFEIELDPGADAATLARRKAWLGA